MAKGKRTKPAGELTAKQAAFVQEYLKDLNAYQAAQRAGFSEKTARAHSAMWVRKDRNDVPAKWQHIWDAVQEAMAARSERLQVDSDWVLKELLAMYQIDITGLFKEGRLKPFEEMSEHERKLFSSFAQNTGLKVFDKMRLLEMIGQHVKVNAFKEQVDVTGNINVAEQLMAATRRKRQTLIGEAKSDRDAKAD